MTFEHTFESIAAIMRGIVGAQKPPNGAFAAGIAGIDKDGTERAALFAQDIEGAICDLDTRLRLRVASITKLAVARTVLASGLAPEQALADVLPWPDRQLTIGHLMSHRSGLTDAAGYILPPPADVVATALQGRSQHPPGAFFRYANINYVLLGCAAEHAMGERLDRLVARYVLRPAGIGGGLNWINVTDRNKRLALRRWDGKAYVTTIDGPEGNWEADLIWRDGEGRSLADWQPGWAPLMSPQGGLRASTIELARLARFTLSDALGHKMARPVWCFDGTNGRDGGGLFHAVGHGVTIYDDHPLIAGDIVGHSGQALGAATGAWLDRRTGAAWGYAIIGGSEPPDDAEDEVFFAPPEHRVMQAIAAG